MDKRYELSIDGEFSARFDNLDEALLAYKKAIEDEKRSTHPNDVELTWYGDSEPQCEDPTEFKVGDKVRVDAAVMGYGIPATGIVSAVDSSLGQTIISVDFIEPRWIGGRTGCTVSNWGFLKHI